MSPPEQSPTAPRDEEEAAAWQAVVSAWEDEAAHRAYLGRFADLDGLARAGGRYRAVLAERPDDPLARRFRDEIVKRATAAGLAMLPRTAPPRTRDVPRWVKGAAIGLLATLLAIALYMVQQLASGTKALHP
jgi:hypothetical protein